MPFSPTWRKPAGVCPSLEREPTGDEVSVLSEIFRPEMEKRLKGVAHNLHDMGFHNEKIAQVVDVPISTVQDWLAPQG